MIAGTSLYCHENSLDAQIQQNIYEFIQNKVKNMTAVAMTMLTVFLWLKDRVFFLPEQSQRSRDGSRSFGLFRKGKIGIIAKFHRTDLVI